MRRLSVTLYLKFIFFFPDDLPQYLKVRCVIMLVEESILICRSYLLILSVFEGQGLLHLLIIVTISKGFI